MILEKVYDELMAQIEDLKKAVAAMGGGGTDDYDDLSNRPKVNNITLTGNKKSSDLKIVYSMTEAEYAAATKNAESIYCLQENATTFEEEDETGSEYIHWSASGTGYVASWVYAPSNQNFTDCTAVECDDDAITIDAFQVEDGNVQVFLSCEDTSQIGETVTFTYTLTQPAGSTRIMKNGLEIARSYSETSLYDNSGTTNENTVHLSESLFDFDQVILKVNRSADNVYQPIFITLLPSRLSINDNIPALIWASGTGTYFTYTLTNATTLTLFNQGTNCFLKEVIGIKF